MDFTKELRAKNDWILLLVGINCNFWNEILVEFLMHHLPVFFCLLSHENLVILRNVLFNTEKASKKMKRQIFSCYLSSFSCWVRRGKSGTSLKFQKDASKAKIISHFLLHFIYMKESKRYLRYRAFHITLVASLSLSMTWRWTFWCCERLWLNLWASSRLLLNRHAYIFLAKLTY